MNAITRMTRAWRRWDPLRADALVALVFVAGMCADAALAPTNGHSRLATAVAGSLALLPLAWRRVRPLWAAGSFALLALPQTLLDSFFFGDVTTPFVAAILLTYSLGRHQGGRRGWAAWAVLVVAVGVGIATGPTYEGAGDFLWLWIAFLPPLLAGRAIRSRVALRRELREKAELLEADSDQAAERAAQDERTRIATELQAAVANGVSAMVVQAEAVPRVLAAGDAAAARDAFEQIEESGRDALAEMRRLLGVLRREGEPAELAPQPGLARLDALLGRVREAGLEAELSVEGERRPLAQGIDLTAYRVLQEALEGAAAAGASRAAVTLRYEPRDLELEVRDDRAGGEGSIATLRERVSLYGGHLRELRPEEGGYVIEARLPARATAGAAVLAGGPS